MIGTVLAGKYKIESLIGSGGMANVYKALCLTDQSTVAVKVLKDEFKEDAGFVRRFKMEARAVLTLSHDNIVRSYDVGEDNGCYFIVLEYVEGSTLKELIQKEGGLNPRDAVNIACQMLEALSHAHERGIIHRDVKPQNVIVNKRGKAKLADFGIARDVSMSTRTFAGANVLGSVHYLSPEQARGEQVRIESDIYSMGITLYEMLTGAVPFVGETSVSIALKHLNEEIPAPLNFEPSLPRSLSDIVVKAASKDPSIRYHSAKDMRHDLIRSLREPNGTFAIIRKKPEPKPKRRGPSHVLNIGLLTLTALGLFVIMFFLGRSLLEREPSQLEADLIPKLTEKTLADAEEFARLRGGFVVQVEDWIPSRDYESGVVISQTPPAGEKGVEGDVISVVVSSGNNNATVPDLFGSALADGLMLVDQAGLTGGEITYQVSEFPEGTIFRQDPPPDTVVIKGDSVDMWISGNPDRNFEMPILIGYSLEDTLKVLAERQFKRVLIREHEPQNGEKTAADNTVIMQSPSSGLTVTNNSTVEVTVQRILKGPFGADLTFNVDIEQNDTPVMVTLLLEDSVELVLYEGLLPAGEQQPVSISAYVRQGGEFDTILYVNGIETKRKVVNNTYRGY
jgi:serine/threonine-protein kinase